ncbi:MAG: hypothetical protein WBE41_08235 [Terracidiphilus sp.]
MYTNRRAILSLVAHGRITPLEAERLIAACSSDREAWWLLAGCALCAGFVQFHSHALAGLQPHALAGMVHSIRTVMDVAIPAIHDATAYLAQLLGGNL